MFNGGDNINNDCVIKGKIDTTLGEVLKEILSKKKMTQQELIDLLVKDFVLQNLSLVITKENKGLK